MTSVILCRYTDKKASACLEHFVYLHILVILQNNGKDKFCKIRAKSNSKIFLHR